jgi:6-phosphogluconolactonase
MVGEVVVVDDVPGEFAERVIESFLARPADLFSFALSGGPTARRCYERLAEAGHSQVDWWKVDVYWGDERCVPLDHEDSNYRLGREALLEQVGAVNANYPMRCEEGPDPYHQLVGEVGQFDILHLGLGADGHTASLFPGSPALEADPGRLVVRNHDPSGVNPHQRMTLTYSGIERSRLVLVTVSGAEKADALAATARGETPASRIRADRVVWLVDPPAASKLEA